MIGRNAGLFGARRRRDQPKQRCKNAGPAPAHRTAPQNTGHASDRKRFANVQRGAIRENGNRRRRLSRGLTPGEGGMRLTPQPLIGDVLAVLDRLPSFNSATSRLTPAMRAPVRVRVRSKTPDGAAASTLNPKQCRPDDASGRHELVLGRDRPSSPAVPLGKQGGLLLWPGGGPAMA